MQISYNKPWKLLIGRGMKKKNCKKLVELVRPQLLSLVAMVMLRQKFYWSSVSPLIAISVTLWKLKEINGEWK